MSQEKADLYELYNQRETWCMVEQNPKQLWLRAERRHYPQNVTRFLVEEVKPPKYSRLSWENQTQKHREKRHYPETGKWIPTH
ncbi:spermatogenesis-associated protein 45 [Pelodytes ibericus]